jgi:hypothetical protein
LSEIVSNQWEPSIAFLTDLLSIVTLKSVILGCNNLEKKEAYEKEAREIMNSIDKLSKKEGTGKLYRAIQLNMLANRLIWENETKARLGGEEQNHLLPLTHSINGLRMRAGNSMINQIGGRKDMNIDRLNEELCRKFGFDFSRLFDE